MAASLKGQSLLKNLPRVLLWQQRYLGDLRPKPWIHRQKKPIEKATGNLEWARPLLERQKKKEEGKLEEPPKEPHKLFAISRLRRSLKGVPKRERYILKQFGLEEEQIKGPSEYSIVKNTESNSFMLMKIKHLVKIVPITFPNGLPKDESDYPHTLLKENGEFIIKPRIEGQVVADQGWLLDLDTKKKHLQRVLDERTLMWDQFPAQYTYKFNQDGKELRYSDLQEKKKKE